MPITIGRPEEWADFERRHERFFAVWPELQEVIEAIFNRTFTPNAPTDRVVYVLGRGAVEEFMEILLNAGNGYGIGGLKLLRGMFERVVTASYLRTHPETAEDFLHYHKVHVRRVVNHLRASGADPSTRFSETELSEIETDYQAVKACFQEEICKKCGLTRDRGSWSALDLAAMAREVGVGAMYPTVSFVPTMLLHTTVTSMMARLEESPEAVLFKPGAQRKEADAALVGAHLCLSLALEDQIEHFGLSVDVKHVQSILERAWPVSGRGTASA